MDHSLSGAHRLALRRDLSEIGLLNRFIEELAQASGWPARLIFTLQLCLEEAVANVIRHGSVRGGASAICVWVGERADRIIACVEDEGEAFDPTGFNSPPPPHSLPEASVGGMGIPLMRRFTTRIDYARVGPRNRLVLEFGKGARGETAAD